MPDDHTTPKAVLPITDDELAALALAADPHAPIADDAVPIGEYLSEEPGLLPSWYMAAATARVGGGRWRTVVVLSVVAAFLAIEALGLCSAYGALSLG